MNENDTVCLGCQYTELFCYMFIKRYLEFSYLTYSNSISFPKCGIGWEITFKPTDVRRKKAVFRYIFYVLICFVFWTDDYRTCTKNIYNSSYIILETEINSQNAVTFVLVKLDTKEHFF